MIFASGLATLLLGLVSASSSSIVEASDNTRILRKSSNEKKRKLLNIFDYLPDFDLPDVGDILDSAQDTLCNNGVGVLCDQTITGEAPKCQAQAPLSSEEFDINQYIKATWYVQKQQQWPLLSKKQMNCVTHTYMWRNARQGGYLNAYQYANDKKPGGTVISLEMYTPWAGVCLEQESGGQFGIANCGIADATGGLQDINAGINPFIGTAGPYWVLAVGEEYEWAIVSGGQPDVLRKTKKEKDQQGNKQEVNYCSTPEGDNLLDIYNGAGLFLMTRDPIPTEATMGEMMQTLKSMRIWDGDLFDVDQVGCDYNGATIVNDDPSVP